MRRQRGKQDRDQEEAEVRSSMKVFFYQIAARLTERGRHEDDDIANGGSRRRQKPTMGGFDEQRRRSRTAVEDQ